LAREHTKAAIETLVLSPGQSALLWGMITFAYHRVRRILLPRRCCRSSDHTCRRILHGAIVDSAPSGRDYYQVDCL